MEDYGLKFRKELEMAISQIPEGKVARLTDIADALGDRRAVRVIYGMLGEIKGNTWRVVRSDMSIIDSRLKEEVEVRENTALSEIFRDFRISGILRRLRKEQEDMRSSLSLADGEFSTITGVDIGYAGKRAYVALSTFHVDGMHIRDEVFETTIEFPYIPTYLSYREGPAILRAIEQSAHDIEALMIDGNGILHPEHLGLASFVGIKAEIPSIGVAKSLLCGDLRWIEERKAKILLNGKKVGYALLGKRAKKPVYVSPGNMVSPEKAAKITERFMKHRIPEPTRRAHQIAAKRKG